MSATKDIGCGCVVAVLAVIGVVILMIVPGMCYVGGKISSDADNIMANPTTLTGSIGVIMSGLNAAELAKKIGVRSVVIVSGANLV